MGIDPVSLTLVAMAGSTLLGTVGAIQGGQAAKANANYQAQVARNNAIIAERNAAEAERRGVLAERDEVAKARGFLGAQVAAQSASGLAVNEGSAVDLRQSAAILGRQSIRNVRDASMREAYGFRVQGSNQEAEASLLDTRARQAGTAGWIGGFGSLLGGAASVGNAYLGMQQAGAPPEPDIDWSVY